MTQYKLTPADVMELRASVRWRINDRLGTDIPLIRYDAADDMFVIHTQGHIRAMSKRIEMLGACLRAERAKPGFMVDIMDSRIPCDEALLAPDEQAALASKRRFADKAAAEYAAEQARLTARKPAAPKPPQPAPTSLALDDLFDDLG